MRRLTDAHTTYTKVSYIDCFLLYHRGIDGQAHEGGTELKMHSLTFTSNEEKKQKQKKTHICPHVNIID